MSDEIKHIFMEGEVKWAKVQTAHENLDEQLEYSLDIECSEDQLTKLKGLGVSKKRSLKTDETTGKTFLTVRRPVLSRQGKELKKLVIVGPDLMPFTGLIGNGSKVKVKLQMIPYTNKFGTGTIIRPSAIQVIDLVVFEGSGKGGSNDLDGFTAVDSGSEELI